MSKQREATLYEELRQPAEGVETKNKGPGFEAAWPWHSLFSLATNGMDFRRAGGAKRARATEGTHWGMGGVSTAELLDDRTRSASSSSARQLRQFLFAPGGAEAKGYHPTAETSGQVNWAKF